MTKPYILSPAGDFDSLVAAINAGADEVYFGLPRYNARYNAKNFDDETLKRALDMCKILGVKSNITVNTLITDREMDDVLSMMHTAACLGADAFIVQDLGLASLAKQQMPSLCLHASTQCACHNAEGAKKLNELGFDRVVLAREMPYSEIEKVTKLGVETEIFVHGALCVCQSGMCLMSSVIGDRSGNRGLCAQPCRLPYTSPDNANKYPLSLKDLSVANRISEILSLGVTSLKIEGRMKSPEYVYSATKIWRTLLDSEKNADKSDMKELSDIFSRGGFTDKYFSGKYVSDNRDMYGTRKEGDKENTRNAEKNVDTASQKRTRKITLSVLLKEGENAVATARCGSVEVTYTSDFVCEGAKNLPLDELAVKNAMSKLGTTLFEADEKNVSVNIVGSIFLPKSSLNALRRGVTSELENALTRTPCIQRNVQKINLIRRKRANALSHLSVCKSLDVALGTKADNVCFPLWEAEKLTEENVEILKKNCRDFGVCLPRVVYSSEMERCEKLLSVAREKGAGFVTVSNIGQVDEAKKSGLAMFSDIGMNVFNSATVRVLESMGFSLITASPELNEAQIRDLCAKEKTRICGFVKGHLPVMVLESCIVKAGGKCKNIDGAPCTHLCDRIGKSFAVYGERRLGDNPRPCRNIIYNAVETDILSKKEKLEKMNLDTAMRVVLE